MADRSGIQTPYSDAAFATPDVGGQGANGIGGGLDQGSGGNGIIASPFDKAIVPTPGGQETPCADLGQPVPAFASIPGGDSPGTQAPWDITTSRNTVDRK